MSFLLFPFVLVKGANATFNDAANSVVSAASVLNDQVNGWSSAKGLPGALAIQNKFPALSSALGGLEDTAKTVTSSDIDVQAVHHLSASISTLLDSLSEKAADFNAIQAGQIAAGDLKVVSTPATDIIDSFIRAVGHDEAKWNQVSGDLHSLESKLNDANKVYGISPLRFSPDPTFGKQESPVHSSVSGQTSIATTAAVKSGSAVKGESRIPVPTTANVIAHNGTRNSTANNTIAGPHLNNGASNIIVDFAAVGAAAGALAMLI